MTSLDVRQVLLAPVVSEKSYNQIDDQRYTFRVHKDAHRLQVRQAVEYALNRTDLIQVLGGPTVDPPLTAASSAVAM